MLSGHVASPADALILKQPAYLNGYWLFQIVVYALFRAGGPGAVTFFFLAAWLAIFLLWARTSRACEFPQVGLPLALLSILACQTRFEERPEVLSWLFLALLIRALSRPEAPTPRGIALLGLVQVVWTNVHGYFFLGPALALLALVTSLLSSRGRRDALRLAGLCLVLCAASLVSPFGIHAWTGIARLAGLGRELRFAIEELRPPLGSYLSLWTIWAFWLCWAATALGVLSLPLRKRELLPCALASLGLLLSATSLRNLPALVIFAGPLWGALLPAARRSLRLERITKIGVSLACLALVGWTIQGGFYRSLAARVRFGLEPYAFAYPARFAAEYLRATGWRGSVFNHPLDGGYLEFQIPDLTLYGDSRFSEPGPVREYLAALFDRERFLSLDARHRFDAVLVNLAGGEDPLLRLLELPEWKLAYADLHRALLVNETRASGAAAPRRAPRFYAGEDLTNRLDGYCAIRWAYALAKLERADLLLALLAQVAAAERVPSPVLAFALEYARREKHPEILEAARALRPRMLALTPEDAAAVDRRLR